MSTNVIMPVLGMVQDTGRIVRWLKKEGETVSQGELLMEIETDKAIQEIESPASGILAQILAREGDDVPVTKVVAIILTPEEYHSVSWSNKKEVSPPSNVENEAGSQDPPAQVAVTASPLAARMASENNLDLMQIKPQGGRVEKADILAYLAKKGVGSSHDKTNGRKLASPKARRLAQDASLDLTTLEGSGPNGAILAQDVERRVAKALEHQTQGPVTATNVTIYPAPENDPVLQSTGSSRIWRRMAEHTTHTWTTTPHFYLQRTVKVARFLAWHAHLLQQNPQPKITITDMLILITSRALVRHPNINVIWQAEKVNRIHDINISFAVAVNDGLVVPVVQHANRLGAFEIAQIRKELVIRAESGKLRLDDTSGGTFTISNLGMYGVDSFNALLNGPQAAILAVGRIFEQVLPINGVPAIQPTMNLTVSFDHRAIDGANGAKFLQTLAEMIEEPLALLS